MPLFYYEGRVGVGDETLHLVLNFRALEVIEGITGEKMPEILPQLVDPPHALGMKVLYGMLCVKHEGISMDEVAGHFYSEHSDAIGLAMADVIKRAYPRVFGKEKGKNPPKRRGASTSSSSSGLQTA